MVTDGGAATAAFIVGAAALVGLGVSIAAVAYVSAAWVAAGRIGGGARLRSLVGGRHVLVAGASRGLGRALAGELAAAGARVTLVARRKAALEAAAAEIRGSAGSSGDSKEPGHSSGSGHSGRSDPPIVRAIAADLGDYDGVVALVRSLHADGGAPDWVVCNAGASVPGFLADQLPAASQPSGAHEHMIATNYTTSLNLIRALVQVAREQSDASANDASISGISQEQRSLLPDRIVLVGSVLSIMSFIGYSAYAASKYALRGLADSLRSEFLPLGIHVHVYFPANMDTPGFATENETKPAITAEIEGNASTMSAQQASQHLLSGIAQNRYAITNDYLGELVRIVANGCAPRPNPVAEALALPILSLAFSVWSYFTDMSVLHHFKAKNIKKI